MGTDCPKCGNKRTRSVVAIYESGTKRSRGKAGGIRFGANGRVSVSGGNMDSISSSLLVERLNPPIEPSPTDYSGWIGLTVIGLLGLMIWLLIDSYGGTANKLNYKIFFICCLYLVLSIVGWKLIRDRDQLRVDDLMIEYQRDYREWSSLWYCSKCANVYAPHDDE